MSIISYDYMYLIFLHGYSTNYVNLEPRALSKGAKCYEHVISTVQFLSVLIRESCPNPNQVKLKYLHKAKKFSKYPDNFFPTGS